VKGGQGELIVQKRLKTRGRNKVKGGKFSLKKESSRSKRLLKRKTDCAKRILEGREKRSPGPQKRKR